MKPDYRNITENNLPEPRPGRAGSLRLVLLAIIAISILCCSGFWLTRTRAEKDELAVKAADSLGNLLEGTPLAKLADVFRPAPPPPPHEVTHPATEAGTLAGQIVTGTVAAPMDFGPGISAASLLQPRWPQQQSEVEQEGASSEQHIVFDQEPLAPVTEDSRVKPGYLAAIAQWLANHYKPGAGGGHLNVSAQSLNQECGGRLAGSAPGGRSGLLKYAFHPAMINGLYNLYIERFMSDLDNAARERGLDAAQNRQFHRAIAGKAASVASSLAGVMRVSDLAARLASIDELAQKAVDANADLTTAVFELDQLREGRASQQEINTAQMRVDGSTARYRRASENHIQAQAALAAEIRRYSGQNTDEESALFMASWVARRFAQGGQARGALESCVAALRDLSARCARYGEDS